MERALSLGALLNSGPVPIKWQGMIYASPVIYAPMRNVVFINVGEK